MLTVGVLQDDLWITNANCTECKVVYSSYDPEDSSTSVSYYEEVEHFDDKLNLEMTGFKYSDQVKVLDHEVNFNLSVANLYVDVLGLALDGVLGLGHDENSIVYKMFTDGKIDEPTYSLSYLNYPYLILGKPNYLKLSLFVDSNFTIAINSTYQASFEFNEEVYEELLELEFNSISSYITGPFEILEVIFKNLIVEHGCYYMEEMLLCVCEDEYADFIFKIGDATITIPSENYFIMVRVI